MRGRNKSPSFKRGRTKVLPCLELTYREGSVIRLFGWLILLFGWDFLLVGWLVIGWQKTAYYLKDRLMFLQ